MARKARVTHRSAEFIERQQQRAASAVLQAVIVGGSEVAALTPRASSNLINSQFKRVEVQGTKIIGTFGYTAEYAMAVHEAPGKMMGLNIPRPKVNGHSEGVVWGPSAQPHFVTVGFERAEPKIREVIKRALKV